MKKQVTNPTGKSQVFDVNETFFSTTDAKGRITAGNDVFARTSGYSLAAMVGQPHNLIRHPEMPRLVFRMLWDACRAGKPFMGYVKNQAMNGNHYWVFAVIVPLPEGFLSVRIKPTSPLLARVEAMYKKMSEAESAAIAAGAAEGPAAEASVAIVDAETRAAGFESYTDFSHYALNTEIKRRDAEVARRCLSLFPPSLTVCDPGQEELKDFYRESLATYRRINELFGLLDAFIAVCDGIRKRKDAVQTLAREFRLNAININLVAHRLGESGIPLSVIAHHFTAHGESLSRNGGTMAESIVRAIGSIADIASNLSTARLQIEMVLSFSAEISVATKGRGEREQSLPMVRDLRAAFSATLQHAFDAIGRLQSRLPEIVSSKEDMRKDIFFLQVAQATGRTEIVRLPQAEGLVATFTDLHQQVEALKGELDQLDDIAQSLVGLTGKLPEKAAGIREAEAAMSIHDPSRTRARDSLESTTVSPKDKAPAILREFAVASAIAC